MLLDYQLDEAVLFHIHGELVNLARSQGAFHGSSELKRSLGLSSGERATNKKGKENQNPKFTHVSIS